MESRCASWRRVSACNDKCQVCIMMNAGVHNGGSQDRWLVYWQHQTPEGRSGSGLDNYLLDITALLELETQAYRYTRNDICWTRMWPIKLYFIWVLRLLRIAALFDTRLLPTGSVKKGYVSLVSSLERRHILLISDLWPLLLWLSEILNPNGWCTESFLHRNL